MKKQELNHFGKKAQVHELCRETSNLGHECEDDYSEIKNIQNNDFNEVVIPLLSNQDVAGHLVEIQRCYR